MAIALSHGGPNIYSSPASSRELLVGTTKGVVTLERTASGWEAVRRSLPDLHIHAILIEPESKIIFAGSLGGGIYASTDGGKSWERRDSGVTERSVYSLATALVGGESRLYAGTEPAHLFLSDDLGLHWQEAPALRMVPSSATWSFPAPPHAGHVKNITFDPLDSRTMYAGVEQGGLLKSVDGGKTWSELFLFEDAAGDVHRVVIDPRDRRRMWAPTGSGLYMTTDGGKTWQQITDRESPVGGYPDGLVLSPRAPDVMFLSAAEHGPGSWRSSHFAGSRISRSTDGGLHWQQVLGGLPDRMQSAIEALCLEQSGHTFNVFAGTTAGEVWASHDQGVHWSCVVSGLAPVSKGGHFRNLAAAAP